ncbi:MAG: CBS domain-containing protein [Hyphomicrobium sp.]
MTLRAIIIRADGALVDTGEAERQTLNRVFEEAGFDWSCARADFTGLWSLPTRDERLAHFVLERYRAKRETSDLPPLVEALQRRAISAFAEHLEPGRLTLRSGMAALLAAARREGVRLGLVSQLNAKEVDQLIAACLGKDGRDGFAAFACRQPGDDSSDAPYRRALAELAELPACCLVIEASAAGLGAARAAGLSAVVTRSAYARRDTLDDALFVVDDLPALIADASGAVHEPLGPDHQSRLLMALGRVHAGIVDVVSGLDRSDVMRVSDILASKGSAVKTIAAGESIRALAQRLRTDAVGAMVVVAPSGAIEGIISERDVARGLAEHGSQVAALAVADLMTRAVITCGPDDSIAGISKVMTQRRIRHLPVVEGGSLVGLISIGDVLKHRLEEVQLEASVLRDYAIARR